MQDFSLSQLFSRSYIYLGPTTDCYLNKILLRELLLPWGEAVLGNIRVEVLLQEVKMCPHCHHLSLNTHMLLTTGLIVFEVSLCSKYPIPNTCLLYCIVLCPTLYPIVEGISIPSSVVDHRAHCAEAAD